MVLQVSMAATTREFLIMARHNLIPSWLAVVHPTLGTPYRVIIAYGVVKCERFGRMLRFCAVSCLAKPGSAALDLLSIFLDCVPPAST